MVRPEGRREAGFEGSNPSGSGRRLGKRIREGSFRHLRSPTNRMGGSISTEPRLILHTMLLTRDWFRHFSAE